MNLDEVFPYRGKCAFCGHPDARHRTYDAIRSRYKAGESIFDIAADYDISVDAALAAMAASREKL